MSDRTHAAALEAVKKACAVGKSVAELCELGDSVINEKLQTVYKGKKIEKGIAFPTCISVRARYTLLGRFLAHARQSQHASD
jgi:methionine aminopeptidase